MIALLRLESSRNNVVSRYHTVTISTTDKDKGKDKDKDKDKGILDKYKVNKR